MNRSHAPSDPSRRLALRTLAAVGATAWAAPAAWGQTARAGGEGRLVLVFLRGAYDGLSALVPHADPQYAALRPTIALPRPDGSAQSAIALDATFGLHPALAPLLPLWQQGVLAVVPAAGSPDATRSHFDAQHHWEIGIPGRSGNAPGWLNTLGALQAGAAPSGAAAPRPVAVGVGEANPQILAGTAPVQLVPSGAAATREGAVGDERTRDAILRLYAGDDPVSQAFRAGASSRVQTARMLGSEANAMTAPAMAEPAMEGREMQAANNGALAAQGLALDARHLGTLMRQDRRLRIGFLSAGGWDTHANQGGITGALASNLASLAAALVQLRRDFAQPGDVIVVCSEFGRTAAENGTRGTDHGHGNALWLIGDRVQGGRWHGQWTGLEAGNLNERRDLPVHHDFRAVLAQVLRGAQGLAPAQIERLFPGFAWDRGLDGLMRA